MLIVIHRLTIEAHLKSAYLFIEAGSLFTLFLGSPLVKGSPRWHIERTDNGSGFSLTAGPVLLEVSR